MKNIFFCLSLFLIWGCAQESVMDASKLLGTLPEAGESTHIYSGEEISEQRVLDETAKAFLYGQNAVQMKDSLFLRRRWLAADSTWFLQVDKLSPRGSKSVLLKQQQKGGPWTEHMSLAFASCDSMFCEQQDAFLWDLNEDGWMDLVVKYAKTDRKGNIRQERLALFTQDQQGHYQSTTLKGLESRSYPLKDVGILRLDFDLGKIADLSKKEVAERYAGLAEERIFNFGGVLNIDTALVLYPDTQNELVLKYNDSGEIEKYLMQKPSSNWYHSNLGLYAGMSLEALEQLNQERISFYGFDWEYEGKVSSWNYGTLSGSEPEVILAFEDGKQAPSGLRGDIILHSDELTEKEWLYVRSFSLVYR